MLAKRAAHSASSGRWLKRQQSDPYSRSKARLPDQSLEHADATFVSRAAHKLLEIQRRFRLIPREPSIVLDLGAAPGSWTQACALLAPKARIFALDLLPLDPVVATLPNVTFLQGDFLDAAVQAELADRMAGQRADVVLSDMVCLSRPICGGPSDIETAGQHVWITYQGRSGLTVSPAKFLSRAAFISPAETYARQLSPSPRTTYTPTQDPSSSSTS
jgi:23S rRNA U2552 (ribose-2'-O)-methylase RlmE/FtsJ